MRTIYIFCALIAVALTSCEEGNELVLDSPGINSWLHQTMADEYLWSATLPAIEATDLNRNPRDFFNSELRYRRSSGSDYSKDTYGDRFSRITELGVQSRSRAGVYMATDEKVHDLGLGLRYFVNKYSGQYIELQVVYVIPKSPAHNAGIRRGDKIHKVNKVAMPAGGGAVLDALAQEQVTLSFNYPVSRSVELSKADYYDTPVIFDSVFDTKPNKTAYLVYNHFTKGVSDRYMNELNAVFLKFKNEGVSSLILDLRYNGGGELEVARHLASLIVRRELLGRTMMYKESRASYGNKAQYSSEQFVKEGEGPVTVSNIDAQDICILTTENTASASELIIHTLKPYYGNRLTVVGQLTVGKNLGSKEIKNPRYRWQLNPITMRVYDVNYVSGYEEGIAPSVGKEMNEYNNMSYGIGDFGDSNKEPLVRSALSTLHPEKFAAVPQSYQQSRQADNCIIRTDLSRDELIESSIVVE